MGQTNYNSIYTHPLSENHNRFYPSCPLGLFSPKKWIFSYHNGQSCHSQGQDVNFFSAPGRRPRKKSCPDIRFLALRLALPKAPASPRRSRQSSRFPPPNHAAFPWTPARQQRRFVYVLSVFPVQITVCGRPGRHAANPVVQFLCRLGKIQFTIRLLEHRCIGSQRLVLYRTNRFS